MISAIRNVPPTHGSSSGSESMRLVDAGGDQDQQRRRGQLAVDVQAQVVHERHVARVELEREREADREREGRAEPHHRGADVKPERDVVEREHVADPTAGSETASGSAEGSSIVRSAPGQLGGVADPPGDADRRDAVGVRADDVEGAVADHHRARLAEGLRARGRSSPSCPRCARLRSGPTTSSKCSRRPIAASSGSANACGLEVATASRWPSSAASASGMPGDDRRLGQRRVLVALAVAVDAGGDDRGVVGHLRAARRRRRRTAGRCRAAAPRRVRSGRSSLAKAWRTQERKTARESTSTPSRSKITVVVIAQDPLRVLTERSRRAARCSLA